VASSAENLRITLIISAIFFDAKDDRDTVICERSKDGVLRQVKKTVSHYSVVEQPGDSPLGFFVPEASTGK
jgi:hypothetical protein